MLLEFEIVEAVCKSLLSNSVRTATIGLEGLENILKNSKKMTDALYIDKMALRVEKCGGLKTLESLLKHHNVIVYSKALKLIEDLFGVDNQCNDSDTTKPISIFDFCCYTLI
eukprot:TRINITY_DN5786_c0_g1_i5.p3 TRINITY_DN5786_c0_g1~~TRINITY_DN5786_c0_g1_i5.p3  ORF type:complete len:112 (-),score=18.34 TRINITY_DN5786_c0_g1_i5:109-444(-)